ncbi:MAG: hypothetical protein A2Z38_01295 [Planctomycetes bacterium RBG_19FT_COMBO_48_8]|nr:MAG: hypothetical protein A2Z38_01295 [Planctomycetes bacterium RBG_19FT_COMBO_48_8]
MRLGWLERFVQKILRKPSDKTTEEMIASTPAKERNKFGIQFQVEFIPWSISFNIFAARREHSNYPDSLFNSGVYVVVTTSTHRSENCCSKAGGLSNSWNTQRCFTNVGLELKPNVTTRTSTDGVKFFNLDTELSQKVEIDPQLKSQTLKYCFCYVGLGCGEGHAEKGASRSGVKHRRAAAGEMRQNHKIGGPRLSVRRHQIISICTGPLGFEQFG